MKEIKSNSKLAAEVLEVNERIEQLKASAQTINYKGTCYYLAEAYLAEAYNNGEALDVETEALNLSEIAEAVGAFSDYFAEWLEFPGKHAVEWMDFPDYPGTYGPIKMTPENEIRQLQNYGQALKFRECSELITIKTKQNKNAEKKHQHEEAAYLYEKAGMKNVAAFHRVAAIGYK